MKLTYRARTHAYHLDGKRCRGASSVAKIPDDPFALMQWKPRMALLGAAMQPTILTEVAACHDDKDKLNALVEKAVEHGKGTTGRDYGTAVHEIIRKHEESGFLLDTPEVVRLREQWQALLASEGLEVVQTEGAILHPELKIAGRFDCVVRDRHGRMFVGDVKTGAAADRYLHPHTIQLHVYASAPLLADGIPSGDVDFETTEFTPMHPVDQTVGFVFHLPMEGDPQVIPVDIAAGGEAFRTIVLPTIAWRARTDLRATISAPVASSPAPTDEADAAAAGGTHPAPAPAAALTPQEQRARIATNPDEGDTISDTDFETLKRHHAEHVTGAQRSWYSKYLEQAMQNGVSFHLGRGRTVRRYELARGLIALSQHEELEDDVIRALLRADDLHGDAALFPSITVGHLIGALDADRAVIFARRCHAYVDGQLTAGFDDDGRLTLRPAA